MEFCCLGMQTGVIERDRKLNCFLLIKSQEPGAGLKLKTVLLEKVKAPRPADNAVITTTEQKTIMPTSRERFARHKAHAIC